VIESFIESWPLFHVTYLTGWLIALVLAAIGVVAVARDQIFIGAAVAQASTLGIAGVMWLAAALAPGAPEWLEGDAAKSAAAVLISVAAALATEHSSAGAAESHEARLGWVFLTSAAAAILLVSKSAHGLEEIHRVVASSIIGATEADAAAFALLGVVVAAVMVGCRRSLLLYALDPETAAAIGVPVRRWRWIVALGLGLATGLAIRVSGLLYTFGCLVLPALIAKQVARRLFAMFIVAPAVALIAAVAAFVVAHDRDYPPGQMAVFFLAMGLLAAWAMRWAGTFKSA
jgi:ABC-type Mn2+/Zn2+ transport system permease subunit